MTEMLARTDRAPDRPTVPGDDGATAADTTPKVAALVGNPNAGKSALFNALTGARQKIANYPGVTVERKAGRLPLPDGTVIELVDLPGSYALHASSPDEEVTRKVIMGEQAGQAMPDVLVVVLDASNLEQHLVFAQEVIALGRPTVVALNMVDLAERDGLVIDPTALQTALGVPVIATVAVRRRGLDALTTAIAEAQAQSRLHAPVPQPHIDMAERRMLAHEIGGAAILSETARHRLHARMDRVLLHPWLGPVILFATLFVVFQAVFSWAKPLADGLGAGATLLADLARAYLPAGLGRRRQPHLQFATATRLHDLRSVNASVARLGMRRRVARQSC